MAKFGWSDWLSGTMQADGGYSFSIASGTGTSAGQIQGNVAHGSTNTGFPVGIGGFASTSIPTAVTTGSRVNALFSVNGFAYSAIGIGSAGVENNNTAISDGQAGFLSYNFGVRPQVYNGATWDRMRGDIVSPFSRQPPKAKVDRGTAVTASSVQYAAANATRSKLVIQNQDAAISVYVNFGAAATVGGGSFRIGPGLSQEFTGTTDAVFLIATTGTPAVVIWEF